jgi:cellobiose phosphorylase
MAFALMGENDRAWDLFDLICPCHHGATADQIATYKVEPYVVAADVYTVTPHTGRGGWTWYTGSAGWMYRLLVESLLGVELKANELRLNPRFRATWESYKIHYRYRQTVYHITITRHSEGSLAATELVLDGQSLTGETIPLVDDRIEHFVEMRVARTQPI